MTREAKKGTTRRFGARYGIKIRDKLEKVEALQKAKHKCPICCKIGSIRRLAAGIFTCKRCKNKFTGKAYYLSKAASLKKIEEGKFIIDVGRPEEAVEEEAEKPTRYKEERKEEGYKQESLDAAEAEE